MTSRRSAVAGPIDARPFSARRHGGLTWQVTMIIAYHAIFTTYGTWLPNDPRGSYSKAIYNAELAELGAIRYGRQIPQPDRQLMRRFRVAVMCRLLRRPYYLTNETRLVVADAFAKVVLRLCLSVPACAIMNDHVHFLVWRSKYTIEYLVNQLKGAATHALGLDQTPWAKGRWKVFINDELTLRAAAEYVEANPECAKLRPQRWDFVTPLPPDA
jgi:REP element-mobilizing transposase RayT